ncbi:MAG: uncharacterized protein JWQ45_2218 [Blastococcus sp.]|nr:uncharacterized protein [Blastococcus sp.]
MFDVDWMGMLSRQVLREEVAGLVAEACAWAVGLSDQPHYRRRSGAVAASGLTIGERAANGQLLAEEADGRLELGDARPGSFQDALNALGSDGRIHADRFDDDVLHPFAHRICLAAADRARRSRAAAWAELADDLGEDQSDVADVVRAGGWEGPLRMEAEHLVLAALGDVPLIEVEAEGLPLSLVRAAEAAARAAAAPPPPALGDDELAGALFLADAAMRDAGVAVPVPEPQAGRLLEALLLEGLQAAEVRAVLAHLPVEAGTAAKVTALMEAAEPD